MLSCILSAPPCFAANSSMLHSALVVQSCRVLADQHFILDIPSMSESGREHADGKLPMQLGSLLMTGS